MFLVDWAAKMRIRLPEFETSICDAKYHVSLPPAVVPGYPAGCGTDPARGALEGG
ncbi:hypothetical protein F511_30034 [Dorcoceras hygrometricum]|uniref:Uncharacterized protein n=1 Tax=Dorcoceras hygrometricum TaxID=472368 RepID=A0A2Z7AFW2_9LAMI|nr:hypothetical protein F511_30034 [Dorcoceras hygrometricum]